MSALAYAYGSPRTTSPLTDEPRRAQVRRPEVFGRFFDSSNNIDVHNQLRQANLAMCTQWPVQCPWTKVVLALIGVVVVDTFRAVKYAMRQRQSHETDKMTIREFAAKLAKQLLCYSRTLEETEQPTAATANGSASKVAVSPPPAKSPRNHDTTRKKGKDAGKAYHKEYMRVCIQCQLGDRKTIHRCPDCLEPVHRNGDKRKDHPNATCYACGGGAWSRRSRCGLRAHTAISLCLPACCGSPSTGACASGPTRCSPSTGTPTSSRSTPGINRRLPL